MEPEKKEEICRIDPADLVGELNYSTQAYKEGQGWRKNFVLEDDLWQAKKEIGSNNSNNKGEIKNVPLGKLSLPVQVYFCQGTPRYGRKDYDMNKDLDNHIVLASVFSETFFQSPERYSFQNVDKKAPWTRMVEQYGNRFFFIDELVGRWSQKYEPARTACIETEGFGVKPWKLVMEQHIPKFLKLYEETKDLPAETESLQCIRKAFTDYRR
jgi:hypothetical protein